MAPAEVTVRLVAEVVPRITALVSLIVTFVPLAWTVPKLFITLPSVILPAVPTPEETKFAEPLMVRLPGAVCVIELPEIRVRFVPNVALFRLMASVLTIVPVELLPMVSTLAVI